MADRNETVKLLRECDAGVRMGIDSIDYVLEDLPKGKVQSILSESKTRHKQIQSKIMDDLNRYGEEGKDPAVMATMMSKMKENMKMMTEQKDCAAANYIIDGCNMGIKSIYKYFNQYPKADEHVKGLVDDIVKEEENLCRRLRCYL